MFGPPDDQLLRESSFTLWSCMQQGNNSGLAIVSVKDISAVVAMVPHAIFGESSDRFFVVEKMGLDVMIMAGIEESVV